MAAVLAGIGVAGLDTAVNIDFPRITAHFGIAISQIQWVVVCYTLTSASLMLVFGRVGDMFGYRLLFRIGAAWSGLAFAVCAFAPAFGWLLVGRVLQGIGAGLLLGCGPALATQVYPEQHRARAFAVFTAGYAAAGALGPVVGGAMLSRFDWSCVFWMRIPLALLAFILASAMRLSPAEPAERVRFDWWGALWLVLGLAALVIAVGTARREVVLAAVSALGAVIAAVLFARAEHRTATPIIRLEVFRDTALTVLSVASILVNLASFAVLLLVPFALARMSGLAEGARGALLAISPTALAVLAYLAGLAVSRGRAWPLVLGTAVMEVGLAICALGFHSLLWLALGMAVSGGGVGLFQVSYLDRTAAALPLTERGVAGSLAMLTRTLGLVLGATVLMLVFQSLLIGPNPGVAFDRAFRATFLLAAALPAVAILAWCFRPPRAAPAP